MTWQFPDAVDVVIAAAKVLSKESYVPLNQWESTPATGGLTLRGGKGIADVDHLDLASVDDATFETIWALMDYTLEFSRGGKPRPERAAFRKSGKMVWTTVNHKGEDVMKDVPDTVAQLVKSRCFFYVRCETDDLLFFVMVNSLFSLMLENEPSNHLHSIMIPKTYLA